MSAAEQLLTKNLSTLALAVQNKSASGRGSSKKIDLYGIKKLRELILELAVRGKLVPQNPEDEPAAKLLERIEAEKIRLVKEKLIKKPKKQPNVSKEEEPYTLPEGWKWARLENLCPMSLFDGDWIESKDQDQNGSVRLVQLGDVGVNEFKDISSKFINEETFTRLKCTELLKGDILIARLPNPIGRACVFPGLSKKAITAVDVAILRPLELLNTQYIVHAINSNLFRKQVEEYGKGATRFRISTGNLKSILIPIAPKVESQAIVAKVGELMALCDQIEQQTEASLSAHTTLVENLLTTLTSSASAEELEQNWQRIASHFTTLFTTEASIDRLKQTILQLAVMGKLVPQDPNDEPATKLLERIAEEKAVLIKEGKIKKQKSLPPIDEDEKPFELPDGWEWCRLTELLPQFQNGASSRGDKDGNNIIVLRLADIKDWQVSLEETRTLIISEESINRYSLQDGDVLIIRVNGSADIVGRFITCDAEYDAIYCDHFIRMRFPITCLDSKYLFLLGSSKLIRDKIAGLFISTAGQKTVNQTHIGSLPITLPPLKEQRRIVTKVDQLTTLCDQIKTHLQHQQQTRLQLANAMVHSALT